MGAPLRQAIGLELGRRGCLEASEARPGIRPEQVARIQSDERSSRDGDDGPKERTDAEEPRGHGAGTPPGQEPKDGRDGSFHVSDARHFREARQ